MPMDLQPFIQNISAYGTVLSSKYDVSLSTPPIMLSQQFSGNSQMSYINSFNDIMPFRAISCSTPGTAMLMNETNKWGIGPRIKQAYNAAFPDIRLTLLADSQGVIESYMTFWMNLVYNYSFSAASTATFYTNYRNDIASQVVNINKYDRSGNLISTYILNACVPTLFVPSPLDWSATDETARFTLGLNYTSYDIQIGDGSDTSDDAVDDTGD